MNTNDMLTNLQSAIHEKAYVLAYFSDNVLVGTYENAHLSFKEEHDLEKLMELHVFTRKKEFVAICNDYQTFYIKEVSDEQMNCEYYDLDYYVLGSEVKSKENGYTTLLNKAGKDIDYPFDVKGNEDVKLVVRNYLSFNEDQQLSVDANRLCGFKIGKEMI
ncbi:MAG: CRISPR-associated protein Csx19 [Longicatena sp.]